MKNNLFNIKVGAGVQSSLSLAQQAMEKLGVGEQPPPYYGVGIQ